jgi:maltooligosyltrehalose trehalohydrolase
MTALLLLLPGTPMLFQGQEFGASAPFLYFADHNPTLAKAVQKGRAEFVAQFPSFATPEMQARLPPPHEAATFERCRLDWSEWDRHSTARRLHADLLALRRRDPAFQAQEPGALDGAVLGGDAFALRYARPDPGDERLLLVNLGRELVASSLAEPLLAPPQGFRWRVDWSSEAPEYGGCGTPPVMQAGWRLPGQTTLILKPERSDDGR